MEEIYINVEQAKSVNSNQTGPRSSERRFHWTFVLCLGLLSVFLLAGLIGLGVHHHDSVHDAAAIKSHLQASNNNMSSLMQERDQLKTSLTGMTKERDQLKTSLTGMTEEHNKLQSLYKKNLPCPTGWNMSRFSYYFLSEGSGSWTQGRQDCRDRGADLVVIDSDEEQTFLSEFTKVRSWIGLSDRDKEGTWEWVDGTPLTVTYWSARQPDNGNGDPQFGEEDCVHMREAGTSSWNDLSCEASLPWVCEKSHAREK